MLIYFVCLFVCLHSPFSGHREVFSAIQLSKTSVLCGYCLYGSAVFGVFPLYMFFPEWQGYLENVFLPVTKAPSLSGGEGWYIVEAAAFWEVAFLLTSL